MTALIKSEPTRKIDLAAWPLLSFNIFAVLVAGRDAMTHKLLVESVDPLVMLFIFCATTTAVALIFNVARRGGSALRHAIDPEKGLIKSVAGLGIYTWLTFLACIFGIRAVGATIFSVVEHSLMPISTVILASRLLKESFPTNMKIGLAICTASVVVFLMASNDVASVASRQELWIGGILLAVLGSVLTSFTSVYQKRLIAKSYTPDEVLFFRFALPTVFMALLLPMADTSNLTAIVVLKLVFLGLFGFALPLVFLCFGFMKASLARFSAYIILIPAYTFILGPIFVAGEIQKLLHPGVAFGIVGILVGYIVFEWAAFRPILRLQLVKKSLQSKEAI